MDATIGRRIAELRELHHLSVERVAATARIRSADLVALEAGEPVALSTAAVARVARALDADLSELSSTTPQPSLFFRQAGVPDFFDADRPNVVSALREAASIAILDDLLGREYRRDAFEAVRVDAVPYRQGYELAQQVRRTLGVPVEPLDSLTQIVEDEFGVPVVGAGFRASSVVALTAKERNTALTVVVVNTIHPANRRVDIAHELAHVLFDAPEKDIDYWIELDDDGSQASKISKVEQRARAFAAELLVPREGLVRMFGTPAQRGAARTSLAAARELAGEASRHFRAPPELTTNHLVNQMYVDASLRDAVWKDLSLPVWHPPSRPKMLHRRLAEALRASLLTRMRAKEFLGLSARDELPPDVAG